MSNPQDRDCHRTNDRVLHSLPDVSKYKLAVVRRMSARIAVAACFPTERKKLRMK